MGFEQDSSRAETVYTFSVYVSQALLSLDKPGDKLCIAGEQSATFCGQACTRTMQKAAALTGRRLMKSPEYVIRRFRRIPTR